MIAALLIPSAVTATSPHVTGFDRFGRHGDISEAIAGKLLLSELSCTACHRSDNTSLTAKGGPDLQAAGTRLNHDWVRDFIDHPNRMKPGTTMPDVLGGFPTEERAAAVEALAAYVASLDQTFPVIKGSGINPVPFEFWKHGDVQHGETLYHKIGCVACHEPDTEVETSHYQPTAADRLIDDLDPEDLKELGLASAARKVPSVPLPELTAKYTQQSLTHFLIDPHRVRPAGRMPDFQLRVVDAADLAAYMLNGSSTDEPTIERQIAGKDLIETGRRLFEAVGCSNCHTIGNKAGIASKWLAELQPSSRQSCLSSESSLPKYDLDESQRQAIVVALRSINQAKNAVSADQTLQLSLMKLNCFACHQRDSLGGVGRDRKGHFDTVGGIDLGDEGRLPPPLTGVGRKLQPDWLTKVLKGRGTVRPHMTIQMPVYPLTETKSLAKLLANVDTTERKASEIVGNADDGHRLMDVGCVQCHEFRGASLPGVIGVDLQGVTERVNREWFEAFLRNPGKLKPRTRMPNFFADGTTQDKLIGGGDPAKQIAGMWEYLRQLDKSPLPQKIETARAVDYELKPIDRAKILRTFMTEAGTHAIAVGLPGGMNFAFDAESVGVRQLWKGRFIDAQGTWFVRFAPPADPLGDDIVKLPDGPTVARLSSPDQAWPTANGDDTRFDGYRLAENGVPIFRYRVGQTLILDRLETSGDTIKRTLEIADDNRSSLYARLLTGRNLQIKVVDNSSVCIDDDGTTIQVNSPDLIVRTNEDNVDEALLPINSNSATTATVIYKW